jgi:hypothetical protein
MHSTHEVSQGIYKIHTCYKLLLDPEQEGPTILQNVRNYLPINTASTNQEDSNIP